MMVEVEHENPFNWRFMLVMSVLLTGITAFYSAKSSNISSQIDRNAISYAPVSLGGKYFSGRELTQVVDEFLRDRNIDTKLQSVSIKISPDENKQGFWTVDVEARDYKDDSLMGENIRLILARKYEEFVVSQAWVQFICARGDNAGKPQTALCP